MKHRSVVIGVSAIQQKGDFENLDEALFLMDQAVKEAMSDSGNKSIKEHFDEIRISNLCILRLVHLEFFFHFNTFSSPIPHT